MTLMILLVCYFILLTLNPELALMLLLVIVCIIPILIFTGFGFLLLL